MSWLRPPGGEFFPHTEAPGAYDVGMKNANALKPAGIILSDVSYRVAANSSDAAKVHIATGDADAAYFAARQAASVMVAPHLYF